MNYSCCKVVTAGSIGWKKTSMMMAGDSTPKVQHGRHLKQPENEDIDEKQKEEQKKSVCVLPGTRIEPWLSPSSFP